MPTTPSTLPPRSPVCEDNVAIATQRRDRGSPTPPSPMAKEKSPTISVGGASFLRIPVKTRVVMPEDDILEIVREYAGSQIQPGDIVFMSEKVVAITQGRAIPTDTIRLSWL